MSVVLSYNNKKKLFLPVFLKENILLKLWCTVPHEYTSLHIKRNVEDQKFHTFHIKNDYFKDKFILSIE